MTISFWTKKQQFLNVREVSHEFEANENFKNLFLARRVEIPSEPFEATFGEYVL